jgi:hypothetical protein
MHAAHFIDLIRLESHVEVAKMPSRCLYGGKESTRPAAPARACLMNGRITDLQATMITITASYLSMKC